MTAPLDEGLPRPEIDARLATELAGDRFGVSGQVQELGSQQDRNFLIQTGEGRRHLLKISNPASTRAEVEAQNAVMAAVRHAGQEAALPGLRAPRVLPSLAGREIEAVALGGREHLVRLLDFLDGEPLIGFPYAGPGTLAGLGALAGRVSVALDGLEHPGLERRLQWDLRRAPEVIESLARFVRDAGRRELVLHAARNAARRLAGLTAELPQQAVHGDLTDDNVVAVRRESGEPELAGIIDFGDAMRSWRITELVMVCTTALHREPDRPLAVLPAVTGFHRQRALLEAEVEALWPLLVLRGAVLVVSGEQQLAVDPGNDYAAEAIEREWDVFAAAESLHPAVAGAALRTALGLGHAPVQAVPAAAPGALDGPSLLPEGATGRIVDLSWESRQLRDGEWLEPGFSGADPEPTAVERRHIDAVLGSGEVAVLRYGEPRLTRAGGPGTAAPENTALFAELHSAAALEVRAPFAGTLHATGHGMLLRANDDSAALLMQGLIPGGEQPQPVRVQAGQLIGTTGALRLWHLAATALAGAGPDGSGLPAPRAFVRAAELDGWATVFADPAPFIGAHVLPAARRARRIDPAEDLARREAAFDALQGHYYQAPPQIERGWREFLIDTDGRHYLDMVNNVAAVGHGHPRLADAAADQWRMLNTNSRFHYRVVAEFSERLLSLMPPGFDTVLLVNSGTEAVDLALRLGQAFTGRPDVMCVHESYHGWSIGADAVSTSLSDNPLADETRPDWVHPVPAPNAYRGRYRGPDAGQRYAAEAEAELARLTAAGRAVGTYIAEPRNGNAGAIPTPPGYLERIYAAVRAQGGIVIADEVQVGCGRLGEMFWGFQEHGVVPDVVTVAKALGNGHPLGAVITRKEIAQALTRQGAFFSSAAGSPVSCRIGIEVLDIIEQEGLQANAAAIGERLRAGAEALAGRHRLIGAVHGRGLYQGIELVRDRETLEPAVEETRALCARMLELGVIVQPTGDRQNVLKVKPPMCLSPASADHFIEALDRVLTELGG
ncbi:aminotransferase [Sediminivirga luteola]|uniref:Aminoglycoside phosphotransferase domain-containing protein n=1 Tax=Sediminivirga luteola TaxID=1774748 RepID=A0A8J2TVQ1_9MICO|nr:aminotransferase [Sediminivirga luteola]GGA04737.1 hypothetical protein GCM10011333_04150 [Sediminivirga luteola]